MVSGLSMWGEMIMTSKSLGVFVSTKDTVLWEVAKDIVLDLWIYKDSEYTYKRIQT